MAPIRSQYKQSYVRYYDQATSETVDVIAPVKGYDDFLYDASLVIPAAGSAESGAPWVKKIVGAAPPTVAFGADAKGGTAVCTLTSASEKQDAACYKDDHRALILTQGLNIEFGVTLTVLPTGNAELVWGLLGDWVDGPDAATYSAFFTADGSGEVFCEMDDNATDSSATSGVTAITTDFLVCRIDFTDVTNVLFYVNGARVASGTTFGYAATAANATLQPFFSAYKASGTGVGTLTVDYCRWWMNRS